MRGRLLVLAIIVAGLALLLAACATGGTDDETAEAAEDPVTEDVDGSSDDAVGTDTAADDSDVADLGAAEDEDTEVSDEDSGDYPTDIDEVAELLASEGFALCSDQEAVEAAGTIVPELDLASLEAQSLDRTFVAESYTNTYVGEVTEDLLMGISLDSRYADQAEGVSVYLCDSDDVSIYLWDDIEDGRSTLSNDDVEIELNVAEDGITGTVTLTGEEARSFSANQATQDAGMYVATDTAGEIDIEVRWVVAPDGRQRGRVICCWPTSHITFACGCCLQQH
jgi:hypothetical protein